MTSVKTVNQLPAYQPKTIQITFGTAAEEHVFYSMCNTRAICDIQLDGVALRPILNDIRTNLQQHFTNKSEKYPESTITEQLAKNLTIIGIVQHPR